MILHQNLYYSRDAANSDFGQIPNIKLSECLAFSLLHITDIQPEQLLFKLLNSNFRPGKMLLYLRV